MNCFITKGGFPLVELIHAKRKILVNYSNKHAQIILINILGKFLGQKNSSK